MQMKTSDSPVQKINWGTVYDVATSAGGAIMNAWIPGSGDAINAVLDETAGKAIKEEEENAKKETSDTLALTQKSLAENKQSAAVAKKGKVLSPVNSLIPHNKSASAFRKENAYQYISGVNSLTSSDWVDPTKPKQAPKPAAGTPPAGPWTTPTPNVWNAVDRGNNTGTSTNTVDKGNNFGTVKTMEERSTLVPDSTMNKIFNTVGGNSNSWVSQ